MISIVLISPIFAEKHFLVLDLVSYSNRTLIGHCSVVNQMKNASRLLDV